ncbi:MAG: RNA polymerase sigma factor [Acidobacteria bacterium]|nr:RNA polymerase sigma factor [Acidobacteriota bacterium]
MVSISSSQALELAVFFGQATVRASGSRMDDAELVRAVLKRDRKATAEFVQLFSGRVYSYVRSRLAPRFEQVDDLVHETFLAAWQRLGSFRAEAELEGWILGIARHKVEDHYRDRLSRMEIWEEGTAELPVAAGSEPEIDVELDRRLLAARASAVIAALPEHYATILLWRYWEQKNSRDIGMLIGKSEKAVERLLARARAHFKERWSHE